ncbi:hypothetical protein [Thermostaphylospora chromogena]|uniref:Uncharacterized protein n=1 Tax=Thermostaphylospora chromogena TaxID=35622 RepID=A0A1H1ASX6_9ACTN|nr:hypothetical protein [Thermostaphylospora chromogena]SDQ42848.1 hypothetical protein SAMN04489764_0642 [Thermostaphylospora chromogena]
MSPGPQGPELPADWPGLDGDTGGPHIDHTRVREILGTLRQELSTLRGQAPANMSATWSGPGTLPEVQGLSRVGTRETGSWGAAQYFGLNATQGSTSLSSTYQSLIERIDAMITAVEQAVTNYEEGQTRSRA